MKFKDLIEANSSLTHIDEKLSDSDRKKWYKLLLSRLQS